MIPARPLTVVTSLFVIAALLSGCSAVKAVVKAQSHAVACAQMATELKAAGTGISSAATELSTDPEAVATAVSTDAYKFSVAANKIRNASVKKPAEKAAAALSKFSADLTTFANIGPTPQDEANLKADVTPLQTNFQAIERTCEA